MKWLIIAFMLTVQISFTLASDCTFSIDGNLKVTSQLSPTVGQILNLEDVEIKVSGSSYGTAGTWTEWGTTTTSSSGYFRVTKDKSGSACSNGRYIKVEARFKDDELLVRKGLSANWYTIGERDKGKCQTCNFGDLTFKENANYDRADENARKHADIWALYKKVINFMKDSGSYYTFTKQIEVKYPVDNFFVGDGTEASYVDPVSKVVHIVNLNNGDDHFNTSTLLHELGHVWAFQHSKDELDMTFYWATHWGDTHGLVNQTYVAFHEGFAEFFYAQIYKELFGQAVWSLYPYNKGYFNYYDVNDLSSDGAGLEFMDDGWQSILNTLVWDSRSSGIINYNFGSASDYIDVPNVSSSFEHINYEPQSLTGLNCSPRPTLTFKNILRSFSSKSGTVYDDYIRTSEMNIDDFFSRVDAINTTFDASMKGPIKSLLDPSKSDSAKDLFCNSRFNSVEIEIVRTDLFSL